MLHHTSVARPTHEAAHSLSYNPFTINNVKLIYVLSVYGPGVTLLAAFIEVVCGKISHGTCGSGGGVDLDRLSCKGMLCRHILESVNQLAQQGTYQCSSYGARHQRMELKSKNEHLVVLHSCLIFSPLLSLCPLLPT